MAYIFGTINTTADLDIRYLKLDATNYDSVIFPDGKYLGIDQIRARDAGGLLLTDDGNKASLDVEIAKIQEKINEAKVALKI